MSQRKEQMIVFKHNIHYHKLGSLLSLVAIKLLGTSDVLVTSAIECDVCTSQSAYIIFNDQHYRKGLILCQSCRALDKDLSSPHKLFGAVRLYYLCNLRYGYDYRVTVDDYLCTMSSTLATIKICRCCMKSTTDNICSDCYSIRLVLMRWHIMHRELLIIDVQMLIIRIVVKLKHY